MANTLKTEQPYYSQDNFVQRHDIDGNYFLSEITVTITLSEYRDLISAVAKGEAERYSKSREIDRLEEMLWNNNINPRTGVKSVPLCNAAVTDTEAKADA